ncbi:uncharacterized protein TNCT_438821 [Trichonephila clavata]|uniref:Ig-like domain-containing protein n=1 Tax=Trichonephila clavata TaxID=2740835 RepID=A0A8X6GYV2_TRICU|nr:uncharacterized protein TNCT_438821 [Trichonephila clavata]
MQHLTKAHPRADLEPEFVGEPSNVTVTEGSTALLTCVVENLGFYRVERDAGSGYDLLRIDDAKFQAVQFISTSNAT